MKITRFRCACLQDFNRPQARHATAGVPHPARSRIERRMGSDTVCALENRRLPLILFLLFFLSFPQEICFCSCLCSCSCLCFCSCFSFCHSRRESAFRSPRPFLNTGVRSGWPQSTPSAERHCRNSAAGSAARKIAALTATALAPASSTAPAVSRVIPAAAVRITPWPAW